MYLKDKKIKNYIKKKKKKKELFYAQINSLSPNSTVAILENVSSIKCYCYIFVALQATSKSRQFASTAKYDSNGANCLILQLSPILQYCQPFCNIAIVAILQALVLY